MINKYFDKYREIISYLIVGGLTTVVSLVTYYSLTLTILDPTKELELMSANVISWILSVLVAFILNRKYVFNSTNEIKKELVDFTVSRLLTLFLDVLSMFFLVNIMAFNDKVCKLIVQVLVIFANYLLSKLLVFKAK